MKASKQSKVPLPGHLKHFEAEPPLHICAADVAALVEHWGFTRDGKGFVRKLVKCDVLVPRKFRFQRGLRFETVKVYEYYRREIQPG